MNRNAKRSLGILLTILGIGLAGFIVVRATLYDPDTELNPPPETVAIATSTVEVGSTTGIPNTGNADTAKITPAPARAVVPEHYPVRLSVPSANVNAAVQYVGVKADGSMGNPSNFTDVAWYKLGTVPGDVGSAVIGGHVDNALALSGVFKHLSNTKVGDDVYVTRKDGKVLHFVVDDVESYPYKSAPSRQIFLSNDGKAHLNLVTCAGTWVQAQHSYTLRLVIYTTLVN